MQRQYFWIWRGEAGFRECAGFARNTGICPAALVESPDAEGGEQYKNGDSAETVKKQGKAWQYLKVQEGFYDENGDFKMLRILNGDQTDWGGPQVGDAPSILHFTLTTR